MSIQGGGVAIFVKRNSENGRVFKKTNLTLDRDENSIEACAIKIKLTNQRYLFIVSIYAPPHNNISFCNQLNNIFSNFDLHNTDNYYLIAGDMNARNTLWGDKVSNS